MAEYIESICRSCFHSYVCEQFNKHRDSNNEKCRFFNDHFVPAADVAHVVRCKDCKSAAVRRYEFNGEVYSVFCYRAWERREEDDFCSYGERKEG